MKNAGLILSVALLSGLVGYALKPASRTPEAGQLADFKQRLKTISDVDFEEYLSLKDQKARYEKADEILAKILQLMIYDLGLRQGEAQLTRLRDKPAPAAPEAPAAPSLSGTHEVRPRASGKKSVPVARRASGEKAKDVYRRDQVEDFLRAVEIPDFFNALKSGGPIGEAQMEMINGHFSGTAIFDDPKEAPWTVSILMDAHREGGEIVGTFDIRLSKNGKQFSRTKNIKKKDPKPKPIDPEKFMTVEGDPDALIINAYGDDGYFQLYHFPRINEWHGLVYLKKSLGVFERKGVVHLSQR